MSARDTAAEVLGPDGELVTVDLADPPEWLDLAALRADAAAHGDTTWPTPSTTCSPAVELRVAGSRNAWPPRGTAATRRGTATAV